MLAIHPGEILREEYMAPLGLSANALAIALGIPATRIHEILHEKRGVSTDTAMRLARYFGTDMEMWINLQAQYEACLLKRGRSSCGSSRIGLYRLPFAMEKYSYRVIWSEEDQEFVGLCAEFPSLSWLEEEQDAALHGIVRLVSDTLKDMEANKEPIPEPLSLRKFSGNFVVRTTPEMHRQLAILSAEAEVSLNRYVNSRLL